MKQDHDETAEGLSPDAAAFLDSVRGLDDPSAGDRRRVRRRVLAAVAATGAASAAGGSATAAAATTAGGAGAAGATAVGSALSVKVWIGVAVGLVGAGVAGGVATIADEPDTVQVADGASEVGSRDSESAVGARDSESALGSPESESESEVGARPSESEPALGSPESESASESQPTPNARQVVPSPAAPPHRAAESRPSPDEAARPTEEPSPETLAEELSLIRRAHAAANAGDHGEALRILAIHAQRFPSGALAIERDGARAAALCEVGRRAEGRRAAERFLAAHPSSPLRARVSRACAD